MQRKKVRIRWYGDTFTDVINPVLEVKLKKGTLGKKVRFQINNFNLDYLVNGKKSESVFSKLNIPNWLKNELRHYKVTLSNSYQRSYFLSNNQIYRATLDNKLKFFRPLDFHNGFISKYSKDCILELKYDTDINYTEKINFDFPIQQTKYSKYVTGLSLTHPTLLN